MSLQAPPAVQACVGLGSNIEPRRGHVEDALAQIDALPRTRLRRRSTLLETEAVGPSGQGPYLNAAALVETRLAAHELLQALLEIERRHNRIRSEQARWGPRTLDLDLLLYGDEVIDEPGLRVPHPRMHERPFVLRPLAEIASDRRIPTRGVTVGEALARIVAPGDVVGERT